MAWYILNKRPRHPKGTVLPRVIVHTNQTGLSALDSLEVSLERFRQHLETMVARAFNVLACEQLIPGLDVSTPGIFDNTPMPTDIHVIVLAPHSPLRRKRQYRLQLLINCQLERYWEKNVLLPDQRPSTRVQLNII